MFIFFASRGKKWQRRLVCSLKQRLTLCGQLNNIECLFYPPVQIRFSKLLSGLILNTTYQSHISLVDTRTHMHTSTRSWAGRAAPPLFWSSVQPARRSWASWRWRSWWSGRWWTGCRAARWSCRPAPRSTSSGGCPVVWEASATSDGRQRGLAVETGFYLHELTNSLIVIVIQELFD